MDEHEFRHALRTTMASAAAPPPMSEESVLDVAHRDRRRRRAMWAGGGSAAAVALIAVGVAIVAPPPDEGGGLGVAAQPGAAVTTTGPGGDEPTETSWPNGQTDRTASSGAQHDRGVALLTELAAVVPDGYESPDDLDGGGTMHGPMKSHQAQYADTVAGVEVWEYLASVPVTRGDGVGRLLVEVHTPGNRSTGQGCDLSPALWGMTGTCEEVTVDGERIGVVTPDGDSRLGQWAGYRHADGTLVMVAQAARYFPTDLPALPGLPMTARQLAELAADPRFDLD